MFIQKTKWGILTKVDCQKSPRGYKNFSRWYIASIITLFNIALKFRISDEESNDKKNRNSMQNQ